MAVRMNITIPDSLHEQLQQVKDVINVSGVCQEAIGKVVSLELAKMNAVSKRDEAIVRLKSERDKDEDEAFTGGKAQGLADAVDLDYASFLVLEQLVQASEGMYEGWVPEALQLEKGFSWLFEQIQDQEVISTVMKDRYVEGWVEGALEFWEEVKGEVQGLH